MTRFEYPPKRRGFSLELMNKLKTDIVARISPWIKLHHADYVEYFIYQYYLSCSEVQIATRPAGQQEPASIPHDSSRRNSAQAGLLR